MLTTEIKSTVTIGLVFAFRMLGLFMIFPVLSLYVHHYPDASMSLVGVALGCYGLFQAILQLPLAALSDRFGRKPFILAGLLLFALGGLVAAGSSTLWGIIVGRSIQGAGAIGATLLAFASDHSRSEVRVRVMAIIGICIGASFTMAMILGPLIDAGFGLKGLFLTSSLLACVAMVLVMNLPKPINNLVKTDVSFAPQALWQAIRGPNLWRIYLSVFMLHAVLTMSFLYVPSKIQNVLGLSQEHSGYYYVPILLVSLACVMPFVRRGDQSVRQRFYFIFSVLGLLFVLPLWLWTQQPVVFILLGILFFALFNYLEAAMPAMVSKFASPERRGLILGLYSSAQFLGLFSGGVLGGWCIERWNHIGLIVLSIVLLSFWLFSILRLGFKHNEELSWQEV